jgi:4-amino-4-deoxy-L-arabinose transferase-like glycosyltransferase
VIFSILEKAKRWIQNHRLEAFVLLSIILLGAFFRLYRISEYMTFLGDEGRDVIVVRRLLVDFDLILVGPGTSIGNMYLGPLYYYMMAPALLLANFSPAGPAAMIAFLGVATIFFVWFVAREWFGKFAAVVASLLYAITPVIITYSRSSWNPNIMPFFALLTIYSIWQVWQKNKWGWLIVAGTSMAFVLQSHYLGLLLIPTLGFFWLLTLVKVKGKRQELKEFIKQSIIGGFLFLLLMSPLVIFDARHGWRNFEAIKVFFTQRQTTVSARPWTAIPKLWPLIQKVSSRLITGTSEVAGGIAAKIIPVLSFGAILTSFYKSKFKKDKQANRRLQAYLLLAVWVGIAMIGLGIYKQEIYDHYYGFFFAAPFLLAGGIVQEIIELGTKKVTSQMFLVIAVLLYLLININLRNNPLKYPPNRQLQRTQEVARAVIEFSEGKPFNFAVIAERNYEGAYMYFLEMWGAPAFIAIADIPDETLTEQLFVACEVKGEKCNPETNERPELTNFGWRKIVAQWDVDGVAVYKLIHAQ